MRYLNRLVIIAPLALAACSDAGLPTSPRDMAPSRPLASISDAARGGSGGFYFLAPLVAQPSYSGTFDGTRQVSVVVCSLGGSATSAPDESCTGGTPVAVDVGVTGQTYHTNWKIDQKLFPAGSYYRIRVVESSNHDAEFGHVDVFVGKSFKGFDQSAYVGLPPGTTPIKFRIEQGATPVGGGDTGGGDGDGEFECLPPTCFIT
jgi:hypothetical protein